MFSPISLHSHSWQNGVVCYFASLSSALCIWSYVVLLSSNARWTKRCKSWLSPELSFSCRVVCTHLFLVSGCPLFLKVVDSTTGRHIWLTDGAFRWIVKMKRVSGSSRVHPRVVKVWDIPVRQVASAKRHGDNVQVKRFARFVPVKSKRWSRKTCEEARTAVNAAYGSTSGFPYSSVVVHVVADEIVRENACMGLPWYDVQERPWSFCFATRSRFMSWLRFIRPNWCLGWTSLAQGCVGRYRFESWRCWVVGWAQRWCGEQGQTGCVAWRVRE